MLGLASDQASDGSARGWLVLVCGLLAAGVTAAYATRVWLLVFFGPTLERDDAAQPLADPSPLMVGPLVVLAAASVVGGLAVLSTGFLGVSAPSLHPVTMVVTLVVVAAGAGATYAEWRRLGGADPAVSLGRVRGLLDRELRVDDAIDASAVRGAMLASRAAAATEADVVTPYARGTDAAMQLAGRGLRWLHGGNASRYLAAMVVGAVAVAVVVGRVQG